MLFHDQVVPLGVAKPVLTTWLALLTISTNTRSVVLLKAAGKPPEYVSVWSLVMKSVALVPASVLMALMVMGEMVLTVTSTSTSTWAPVVLWS